MNTDVTMRSLRGQHHVKEQQTLLETNSSEPAIVNDKDVQKGALM